MEEKISEITSKVKKAADFNFATGKIELAKALYQVVKLLNSIKANA